jgi:hypothetical protein
MPRPKGAKNKSTQPKIDPRIEEIYETVIEYDCPVRGRVKQKVLVKKLRDNATDIGPTVNAVDPIAEVEKEDDGLSIYSEEEMETKE